MQRRTTMLAAGALAVAALAGGGIAVAAAQDDDRAITGADLDEATAAALAETGGGRVTGTEIDDDGPDRYEIEVTLEDGTRTDVHLDAAFEVLGTDPDGPGDDDGDDADDADEVATPEQLDQAEAAALAHVGGGRVTDREADDGGYEVEVVLEDGSEVDVSLDAGFQVVRTETDATGDD